MNKRLLSIVLVLLVGIGFLMLAPFQQNNRTDVDVGNHFDPVKGYTLDLQEQRENCYSNILLLGTLDEQQIQKMTLDLTRYLREIEKINKHVQAEAIENELLHDSIELDLLLIKKTLTAIETKDESYLNNIAEIYSNLVKYQILLNT